MTASAFGLGATMSNFIGQLLVEKFGHIFSLSCSMWLSLVPIVLFGLLMPETQGQRGVKKHQASETKVCNDVNKAEAYTELI